MRVAGRRRVGDGDRDTLRSWRRSRTEAGPSIRQPGQVVAARCEGVGTGQPQAEMLDRLHSWGVRQHRDPAVLVRRAARIPLRWAPMRTPSDRVAPGGLRDRQTEDLLGHRGVRVGRPDHPPAPRHLLQIRPTPASAAGSSSRAIPPPFAYRSHRGSAVAGPGPRAAVPPYAGDRDRVRRRRDAGVDRRGHRAARRSPTPAASTTISSSSRNHDLVADALR